MNVMLQKQYENYKLAMLLNTKKIKAQENILDYYSKFFAKFLHYGINLALDFFSDTIKKYFNNRVYYY